MRKITPKDFSGSRAWEALDIERFSGTTTVRLHWTNKPSHINGTLMMAQRIFVVVDGEVDMHTRKDREIAIYKLQSGDIFHAENGDEHVAHPVGVARVLVIEQEGSV